MCALVTGVPDVCSSDLRKLVGRSLRWELNIGCPTEPHENPKVVDIFRRIAQTAWLLAADDRLAEQDVLAAWALADCETELDVEPSSEERLVGKAGVSTCCSRVSRYH